MNSIGDKIVFAQIKEGREQLIAINAALRRAFEAAGFDCVDRFTPHVTVMKVRRKNQRIQVYETRLFFNYIFSQAGGKFSAEGGIPPESFAQFKEHSFGSQVIKTEHHSEHRSMHTN